MARGPRRAAAALATLAITLAPACKGPSVPHPMAGQTRYTCCNLRYEKPEISDANYQVGTIIPFGTRVDILEVSGNTVKFQPAGHPPMTLSLRYGKDVLTMNQYVERIFLSDDPHAKLRSTPARGRKGSEQSDKTRKQIEQGVVDVGMTHDQVLMALGYPPAHRTPSLDSPAWTYWQNRWVTMIVHFDGDKVASVQR